MSFLQQLGKGFVRSAVNQVGRDGGRVISNKIYKNKHATPVNMVGGKEEEYIDYEDVTNKIIYKVRPINFSFIFELFGCVIACIIYTPYSSLIVLIYGILNWFNPNVKADIVTENGIISREIRGQKSSDFTTNRIKAIVIILTSIFVTFFYYLVKA